MNSARLWAVVLSALPALSWAAGSPSFPRQIKSVHQLIIEGERPEISACLYAAQLAVSHSAQFERIRWENSISDQSVVREHRLARDWVRVTTFDAAALTQAKGVFSRRHWTDVRVECQQTNEKLPVVTLRPSLVDGALVR